MQRLGLAALVVEVPEDGKGADKHGLAPSEADSGMARLGQVAAAGAADGGFAPAVGGLPAGGQGALLDGVQGRPVAAQQQEAGQTADQLPGRAPAARRRRPSLVHIGGASGV